MQVLGCAQDDNLFSLIVFSLIVLGCFFLVLAALGMTALAGCAEGASDPSGRGAQDERDL
jgi:hypothetical protein